MPGSLRLREEPVENLIVVIRRNPTVVTNAGIFAVAHISVALPQRRHHLPRTNHGNCIVFVAVEDQYFGLIPKGEVFGEFRVGQEITARVIRVREDGKLDLSPRKAAYLQMDDDAGRILERLDASGGKLKLSDNSDPEEIRRLLGISKNAFKRAAGRLLKQGKIGMSDGEIYRKNA